MTLRGACACCAWASHTHLITSAKALPLLLRSGTGLVVEMTDGTSDYNQSFRRDVGFYYDLVKASVERIALALAAELKGTACTAVAVTPGWLRSEKMLENFGVTEQNWRDALAREPHFCISESPTYVARGIVALAADPMGRRSMRGRYSPARNWRASMASPIRMGRNRIAGAMWSRCRIRACPPPKWAIASGL